MLTAEQVNQLKQKEKTEFARRSGWGSMAAFAGAGYDFNTIPAPGAPILAEHGQKTVNPLLHVKDYPGLVLVDGQTPDGATPSTSGDPIPAAFDESLLAAVDALSTETMQGAASSCRGACSGLCLGTCTGGCTGCGSGCASGCTSGCSQSCSAACTATCTGSCQGQCFGGAAAST